MGGTKRMVAAVTAKFAAEAASDGWTLPILRIGRSLLSVVPHQAKRMQRLWVLKGSTNWKLRIIPPFHGAMKIAEQATAENERTSTDTNAGGANEPPWRAKRSTSQRMLRESTPFPRPTPKDPSTPPRGRRARARHRCCSMPRHGAPPSRVPP